VRVTKDHLVFSAAHFITFNGNVCERLHGHNWRTAVEVAGPLDENNYVFDFIALRDALAAIVGELDHNVDPASTAQVVAALEKAGKNFDFLPIMNADPTAIPVTVYACVRTVGRVRSANAAKATEPTAPVPWIIRAMIS
jgi:6-pyruvoyl-tetrahydropterin synthase